MTSPGERFSQAIRDRDAETMADVFTDDVDFVGLTPGRVWTARTLAELVEVVLGTWFAESDRIEQAAAVEHEPVVDTGHVSYRFAITNPDGRHVVEQQAYYRTAGGRISWMRVVCSGFRRVQTE